MKRTRLALLLVFGMLAALLPVGALPALGQTAPEVVVNEMQVSTSSTDWEFAELFGAAGTDLSALTLVGVESDTGTSAGTIDVAISLAGQSIPADGFWVAMSPAAETAYATTGDLSILDNSFENSTATYFLVSDFTGTAGDDLDTDNDGILDVMPWAELVDALNIRDSGTDFDYGAVSVGPDGTFLPSGTFRCPDGGAFGSNLLNFSTADGTPGAANNCPAPEVVVNEMQVSTSSTDWEFAELFGAAGTDLSALTLVGVESDTGTSAGTIDVAISLAGQSIPADGFWVAMSPAAETAYATTGDLSILDNSFENSTATYFLVSDFTGTAGDDLDTDNDGILDVMPWAELVDALNIRDSGTDFDYGAVSVGPDGTFLPSGTFRCPDGGAFGSNLLNFSTADGTPGAANNCPAPEVGALVINEIDYDQASTDTAEFIEIRNNDSESVNLSGWTLEIVNGSGGGASIARTIALPAFDLSAGDYFVVCGNTATVANCDLDVSPDTDLIQNGAPDAVGLRAPDASLADAVSYEGDTGTPYTEGSGAGLEDDPSTDYSGISRFPDGIDTDVNNADLSQRCITPGDSNVADTTGCGPAEPEPVYIHDIQGPGTASPMIGAFVLIEGVVVGDFQNNAELDNGDLNGFFVQEEDAAPDTDANPMTSEGIFVFAPSALDVHLGDVVTVVGTVAEFDDLTEINGVTEVTITGSGSVPPTVLTLPVSDLAVWEYYEGMLVTFPQDLYINEYFNFDRHNEIVLGDARHHQPTAVFEPGSPEAEKLLLATQLGRITLDDGRLSSNPDPALHPNGLEFTLANRFRGGDIVRNATGVLNQRVDRFGSPSSSNELQYRIDPTVGAEYQAENLRTAAPDDVGGGLQVASFNVLNYFTTIDDGVNDICGPLENQECRGADDADEFTRQRDKIIAALAAMDADVVGVIEIENHPANPVDVPMQDLVDELNSVVGVGTYDYIRTGPIGSDAIKVGVLYKPVAVSPVGDYALLDSSVDGRFDDDRNRPALAQTFMDNSTGGIFTVVNNHLKSKGSGCGPGDDDPVQGNCNLTRTLAAQAMVDWLATDPTGSGDADFMIIGDLNSYDHEDPIKALVAGADDVLGTDDDFGDLLLQYQGEYAYSYVFDGQLGYLDHALANMALLPEVTGATVWHINADEADLIDYDTSFKQDAQDAIYAPDAYRSSDHDPVIVGLDVCDEIAPTFDEVTVSPDTLWPANHKYVDVTATVVVSDNFDSNPTVTLVSVTSNEPDDGEDDGNTVDDIVIVDDLHFQLRAERSGIGTGRIYTITYQVTDACRNSAVASVTVTVPLSQKKR